MQIAMHSYVWLASVSHKTIIHQYLFLLPVFAKKNAPPDGRALSAFSVDSTSWFCGHILSEAVHGPIYSRTTCVDLNSNCLPPQYTIFIGPRAILQARGLHFSFSSLIGYLWTRNHALWYFPAPLSSSGCRQTGYPVKDIIALEGRFGKPTCSSCLPSASPFGWQCH